MISIKEALKSASNSLKTVAQNPQNEAKILLSYYLDVDFIYLITHDEQNIEEDGYFKLVSRRNSHEPIEYITKKVSFYSRDFFIDYGALIPRPETELLVDVAYEAIKKYNCKNIVEVGTGSGIISIMLALLTDLKIIATDINPKALEIAKINAKRFCVEDKVNFIQTSYLDGVKGNFDILVSNPPYIANNFKLEKNLDFEPQNALFGGVKGHEMLYELVDICQKREIKHLVCEMGYDQKSVIREKLPNAMFYQDLSGFDRGFSYHSN